ncbi:hypothetical protein MOSE0_L07448 [Monosporozyma servazzii]
MLNRSTYYYSTFLKLLAANLKVTTTGNLIILLFLHSNLAKDQNGIKTANIQRLKQSITT